MIIDISWDDGWPLFVWSRRASSLLVTIVVELLELVVQGTFRCLGIFSILRKFHVLKDVLDFSKMRVESLFMLLDNQAFEVVDLIVCLLIDQCGVFFFGAGD